MVGSAGFVSLAPDSSTLSPLPPNLRSGLTGVAVLASISLASSTSLFLYFTYKLVRWQVKTWRGGGRQDAEVASPGVDLALGLAERHFGAAEQQHHRPRRKRNPPNQFLILIYNLFLADMHQACAFLLNSVWVAHNGILVGHPACFIQGWLVSTGDLSSSCFITAIAVHTYLAVVTGYKPPQWALNAAVVGLWIFVYGIAIIGLAITHNGREAGGYYVRASAWCWINVQYENLRLLTHYLFIFISLALTSILYTLIFLHLRTGGKRSLARHGPSRSARPSITTLPGLAQPSIAKTSKSSLDMRLPPLTTPADHQHRQQAIRGYHPAFLLYPIIYVFCTLPLALGRIATMAGANVPMAYFCAAGALITSNGWLDVVLWGSTRHALIFGGTDSVDDEEVGLDTFAFMRTPHERRFGNMVWVQGASVVREAEGEARQGRGDTPRRSWWSRGWMRRQGRGGELGHGRSTSQESLRGSAAAAGRGEMAIQMDLVTTVVVEVDQDQGISTADQYKLMIHHDPSAYSMSGNESDKEGPGLKFITSAAT